MEPTHNKEWDRGLAEMRALNKAFLESGKGSEPVNTFLKNVEMDDAFLLNFLRGRKCRADFAWETLKRLAEVRFDVYPQVFPDKLSENVVRLLKESGICGVVKARDSLGRRIIFLNAGAWDPDVFSTDEIFIRVVYEGLNMMGDEDCLNNGLVFIWQCKGVGLKQVKAFNLRVMKQFIDLFWHSFPIQFKGLYIINVPFIFNCIARMFITFFPKKLKERLSLSSTDLDYDKIEHSISPKILPKSIGAYLHMPYYADAPPVEEGFDAHALMWNTKKFLPNRLI